MAVAASMALPAISCSLSCSSASAVKLSSSANLVPMRLDSATVAVAPTFSRSSHALVVRAGEQGNIWDSITSAFGGAKKKVSEVASGGEKELNKASSETKNASKDLGGKAENLKDEVQAKAEDVAEEVKTGIADLKDKVEEAADAARSK